MSARVVVLGGGITGLAAAHHVRELSIAQKMPIELAVIERDRTGGCIETRREDGYLMEMGAESLPRYKPHAMALLDRLGLRDELLEPQSNTKGTLIAHGRHLRRLPEDFSFFTPGSLASLFASGLFGFRGTMRAALEPLVPQRRSDEDESLASFVTRRMGSAVLERLAQPLVGGIYSGDPQRLSMQATLPNFLEIERKHGSLVRGLKAMERSAESKLLTLRDGIGTLVDALARVLGAQMFIRGEVTALTRVADDAPWEVALSGGTRVRADAVICALPAHEAAAKIDTLDRGLCSALQRFRYNSIAVVTLAFDAIKTQLPKAHGVLVPFAEGRHVTAITLSSLKYGGRTPPGGALLRAYIGGALQSDMLQRSDDELVAFARSDLNGLLGIADVPRIALVRRWMHALPEYEVGHLERVAEIERRASALPRFALAGAAYRGVGISDCIASAEGAAERIVHDLNTHEK
jgi:protoporphyrinogen/coproporphyrinogen III oxidase